MLCHYEKGVIIEQEGGIMINVGQAENNAKKEKEVVDMKNVDYGKNVVDDSKYIHNISIDVTLTNDRKKRYYFFHDSVKYLLLSLQIFGLFPLNGYTDKDPEQINRIKPSFKIFLNNTLLVCGLCEFLLLIRIFIERGVSVGDFYRISLYLSTLNAFYALRSLARQWKSLVLYWHNCEKYLLKKLNNNEYNPNLLNKITIITAILLSLAIFDHIVTILDEISDAKQLYQTCNVTKYSSWEFLLRKARPQYLILFPYHEILFLPVEWVNACLAIAWSMQDILIIVVSLVLVERFALWNLRVAKYEMQVIPGRIWYELREDYTKLTELVLKVDENLSTMVLISCASNLYQICSCVFQSLVPRPDFLANLQFWYSFLFILLRTLMVLHFVAEIHERSVESKLTIRIIPSKGWCSEAQRLLDQMVSMDIALSGRKLFFITRKTILIIIATVMTYEIVLADRIPKEPLKKRHCS